MWDEVNKIKRSKWFKYLSIEEWLKNRCHVNLYLYITYIYTICDIHACNVVLFSHREEEIAGKHSGCMELTGMLIEIRLV